MTTGAKHQQKLARLEQKRLCLEAFRRYQAKDGPQKLALAAGGNILEGWFCTDLSPDPEKGLYYCDMTEKFLFPDSSFDYIFCEHGIEHICFEDGLRCLAECYRVLKKDGILRITTPSLEKWVQYYVTESRENDMLTVLATHFWTPVADQFQLYTKCMAFNNAMRNWGHKIVYDFETLNQILLALKFVEVTEADISESAHPELVDIERHAVTGILQEYNRMEIMILEARK